MRMISLVFCVVLLALGGDVFGQCWGRGAAPSVEGFFRPVDVYRWKPISETQHALICNGKQIGGYDHEAKHYLPLVAGEWCDPAPSPVTPPPPPAAFAAYMASKGEPECVRRGELPTGVDRRKLSAKERFSFKGEECDKKKVFEALDGIEDGEKLTDDSKKPVVSVIGGDQKQREEILAAIRAAMPGWFKLWEGPAEDWSFEPGFKKDGQPLTIYAQTADGSVLHRQSDFAGGIAASIEAIRKARPDYDAAADPDLRKAAAPVVGGKLMLSVSTLLALLAAGTGGFFLARSKPQ